MNQSKSNIHRISLVVLSLFALTLIGGGCAARSVFATPDDAVKDLINSARNDSVENLKHIFGRGSSDLLSSGDAVDDGNARVRFLSMYDQKHRLQADGNAMTLIVGENEWPFPVPIVKNDKGAWYFDTDAGKDEIINRRIGNNELMTIQVCQAIVDAQHEYAAMNPDGNAVPQYAQKFLSDPNKKNGLYWLTAEGEPLSPLGPLVAEASREGYTSARTATGQPQPYHGYHYRILTAQGASAHGGAHDYLVGGKLIGGFALVAYPAEYGSSGVMTFIVNHEGVVFQHDLGTNTSRIAASMRAFDPGTEWTRCEPESK